MPIEMAHYEQIIREKIARHERIERNDISQCPVFWMIECTEHISRERFSPDAINDIQLYQQAYVQVKAQYEHAIFSRTYPESQMTLEAFITLAHEKRISLTDFTKSFYELNPENMASTVPESSDKATLLNQLCTHVRQTIMQGLENDSASQAAQARFLSAYNPQSGFNQNNTNIVLLLQFQKEVGLQREQLLAQGASTLLPACDIAANISSHANTLSQQANVPLIHYLGKGFAVNAKLSKSIHQFSSGLDAFDSLKSGVQLASGVIKIASGNLISGTLSFLSALNIFFDEDELLEQIYHALSEMVTQLEGLQDILRNVWTDMQARFGNTFSILDHMDENDRQQFHVLSIQLNTVLLNNGAIKKEQDKKFKALKEQLSDCFQSLMCGIESVMDADCRQAVLKVRENDEDFLDRNYAEIAASIFDWLSVTAENPAKTGSQTFNGFDPQAILNALSHAGVDKLGFASSLTKSILPYFSGISYVSDKQFSDVLDVYAFLTRYRGIVNETEREYKLNEIAKIKSKTCLVLDFFQALKLNFNALISALTASYVNSTWHISGLLKHLLEQENVVLRAGKATQLLSVFESLNETQARLRNTDQSAWQTRCLENWTFQHPGARAQVYATQAGIPELVHEDTADCHSGILSLGAHRVNTLDFFLKHGAEGVTRENQAVCNNAIRTFFALQNNPLINLAVTYGDIINQFDGNWFFSSPQTMGEKSTKALVELYSTQLKGYYERASDLRLVTNELLYFTHFITINGVRHHIMTTQFGTTATPKDFHFSNHGITFVMRELEPYKINGLRCVRSFNLLNEFVTHEHDWNPTAGQSHLVERFTRGTTRLSRCAIARTLITEQALLDKITPALAQKVQFARSHAAVCLEAHVEFLNEHLKKIDAVRLTVQFYCALFGVVDMSHLFSSEAHIRWLIHVIKVTQTENAVNDLLTHLDSVNAETLNQTLIGQVFNTSLLLENNASYRAMRQAHEQLSQLEHEVRTMPFTRRVSADTAQHMRFVSKKIIIDHATLVAQLMILSQQLAAQQTFNAQQQAQNQQLMQMILRLGTEIQRLQSRMTDFGQSQRNQGDSSWRPEFFRSNAPRAAADLTHPSQTQFNCQ